MIDRVDVVGCTWKFRGWARGIEKEREFSVGFERIHARLEVSKI